MKICMIGLGSIGKRHLLNLRKVLDQRNIDYQIDALRSGRTELAEEIVCLINEQYYKVEELPNDYDVIFITTPTYLHYMMINLVSNKTKNMFIEKPVFDNCNYELSRLELNPNGIYYVACPLRYKTILQYIKQKIIPSEKVISCRIISSSYLPEWRKNVDYRKVYSSYRKMGGGVTRDLIHEWDYVIYLFGLPEQVFNINDHMSDLEIDSDDISVYIAKYEQMLLEIHLDYFGRKKERVMQLFTNEKRIDIDLVKNRIVEYGTDGILLEKDFPQEDFYINEMEYFWDCIEGKKENDNSIEDAFETLKIATVGV